jgi:oligopeptide transport system ATP-binding protein
MSSPAVNKPLLEVLSLYKSYPLDGALALPFKGKKRIQAVRNLSCVIEEGETYGLVGESGSGKTTAGRIIAGLTSADSGQVRYLGRDWPSLSKAERAQFRRDLQCVFQDPFSSLDPRQRAGEILEESLIIHRLGSREERRRRVLRTLEITGLGQEYYFRYPHELSGGQRQRLSLARALIINPKIILCDEPVSALDVSIQSQILNILKNLQREMKLTMLFITHDIRVVRHISARIGVMYLGTLVEEAPTAALFAAPRHPYTRALLSAAPDFSRRRLKDRIILPGEIPHLPLSFNGCVFHTRCSQAQPICRKEPPPQRRPEKDRSVLCHFEK